MITLSASGIKRLQEFAREFPELCDVAAQRAVNYTLVKVRTDVSEKMTQQVELKRTYVNEHLRVTKRATNRTPEGQITGTFEPISLARFARGTVRRGKPIKVRVKKGGPVQKFRSAAIVNLSRGGTGLLVRLPKGETLKGSHGARELKPRMRKDGSRNDNPTSKAFLLYGPSVNQIFKQMMASNEVLPDAGDTLEREFFRQIKVLTRG